MAEYQKKKNPRTAGALALVAGPVGFLYVGWRYALAATVVFLSLIVVFTYLLPVPSWLKYVNLPVFAYMAHRICATHNRIAVGGPNRETLASRTLPVAVFSMTSMLPLLAGANAAVMGLTAAFSPFLDGEVGRGLFMLLLVTPLLILVTFVGFVLIATLIDRAVLKWDPGAPRYIFPPVMTVGEKR